MRIPFRLSGYGTLPAWVIFGAFSLSACESGDAGGGAAGGGSGGSGEGPSGGDVTTPDEGLGGQAAGGTHPVADMRVGLTPDAAPGGASADAAAPPSPDAAEPPSPDAAEPPSPDAALPPSPDAAVPPAPDDAVPPVPDAALPPVPDAALPPVPDAALPPVPDAALPPVPDAALPPAPDAALPPEPDAALPPPGPLPPPPDRCGDDEVLVGEFATHCGQVNVVRPVDGAWSADADCSTGCNSRDVAYCASEFPGASRVVPVALSPEDKPFMSAGCAAVFPQPGSAQFGCCAPAAYCPAGSHMVGQFATHCGMVNVHAQVNGPFSVDDDCGSGCDVVSVGYCQKFWPDANAVAPMPVSPVLKPFTDGGCGQVFEVTGQAQYACCAPDVILD